MIVFKEIKDFKKQILPNQVLFNEDCLQVMKQIGDSKIDLICTDAPYMISQKTNFHIGGAFNDKSNSQNRKTPVNYDFGEWDKGSLNLDKLFSQYYRILKNGGTLIFFYDIFKMQELKEIAQTHKFKQPRLCVWQKTNPVPVNSKLNYLSNSREYFITFTKGSKPTFNSEYDNGFYTMPICSGHERTEHKTQKPLKLMEMLIEKHSLENDLVLDCFSGSNTTGVACKNLNRKYIGIEMDKNYFNIGVERVSAKNK